MSRVKSPSGGKIPAKIRDGPLHELRARLHAGRNSAIVGNEPGSFSGGLLIAYYTSASVERRNVERTNARLIKRGGQNFRPIGGGGSE